VVHLMNSGDEQLLLDLLNSTPVVGDESRDLLAVDGEARQWALARGGSGSRAEIGHLRRVRDRLQAVVKGQEPVAVLAPSAHGVRLRPELTGDGVSWRLDVDDDRRLATLALLTWGDLQERMPGRLRPCANPECRLFLLDRSHGNSARWCSMKVCGNRLKVRRHYRRSRAAG
jgi:predicted RNA-binding Zn ribbon-like protein